MNAPERLPLGLVPDLPAEQYHSIPAMSAGGLKRMKRSPAHFFGLQLDPRRPCEGTAADALRFGKLFHSALFEPDTLGRYAVKPPGHDGRTKDGRAWAAEHADRDIVAQAAQQPKEPLFGFDYDDAFEAVPLSKQLAYMDHLEHAGFGNPALKAWLPVAKVGEKFGDCRRVA